MALSGGEKVSQRDAPDWYATIVFPDPEAPLPIVLCGGALVSPVVVVTAAHCLDKHDPNLLQVRVGTSSLSRDPGDIVEIRGFSTHPGYSLIPSPVAPEDPQSAAAKNDVAIVELKTAVIDVRPLSIATEPPAPGSSVMTYGHGVTSPPAYTSDALRRGKLDVIEDRTCRSRFRGAFDGPSVLCAESPTTMICSGDSGSPLIKNTNRGPRLVGVTSFAGEVVGRDCGNGYANGFADAVHLRRWLTSPAHVLAPWTKGRPKLIGDARVGSFMTCALPKWDIKPTKVTYGWAGDDEILHEKGPSVRVTPRTAGRFFNCYIEASNGGGTIRVQREFAEEQAQSR
ncbi:trypsin-like serine protease [Actinoplanes sp. TFC3]|uniref:S1 family peptidase n=1 Tax=Actinoplanes sp. TFC3 TaxID=1710355 RepID=UPI001F2EEC2D|nr:serine protease [Actinoplanes sp. TFC3]